MKRFVTAVVVLASLCASASAAKPVSITGRLVPLASAPACSPTSTHRIADALVFVRSSSVNLAPFEDFNARLVGTSVGGPTCTVIDVTQAQYSAFTLGICGAAALTCTISLDICPGPTSGTYMIFVAGNPGYTPVNVAVGTLLLDPFGFVPLISGTHTAVCQSNPIQVNGSPSLVGQTCSCRRPRSP